jgi:hypothetical protein
MRRSKVCGGHSLRSCRLATALFVLAVLVLPAGAWALDPPELYMDDEGDEMYDGDFLQVYSPGGPGDFQIQYAFAEHEDFDTLWCDTGWFSSGFHPNVAWSLPATMDETYEYDPCPALDVGTYNWRARWRNSEFEETAWSDATFTYLGEEPTVDPPPPPASPPPPPTACCGGYAEGHVFGGWWTEAAVNGVTLRGTRSTIYVDYISLGDRHLTCTSAHRVVIEKYASGNKLGLIQAGAIRTACGSTDCGDSSGTRSYVEYKPLTSSRADFVCILYPSHQHGTTKKYAVLRSSNCADCWFARINGTQVGSVYDLDFEKGDIAGATSEFDYSYSTSRNQASRIRWGQAKTGQTPWQRTGGTCCDMTWITISAPNVCSNTDNHYVFGAPFNQANGWFVRRWVQNGTPNHESCD